MAKKEILKKRAQVVHYKTDDIPTNMIWPNMQVESGSTEPTLWLEIPELNNVSGKWWNGVMTKLYESDYNQTNIKYVDIWINIDGVSDGINTFPGYTEGLSGNTSSSPITFLLMLYLIGIRNLYLYSFLFNFSCLIFFSTLKSLLYFFG